MTRLTGKLLAAMPGIGDHRFERSVILVCAHSPDYTMGLVVNNPLTDLSLVDLLKQLGIEQNIQRPDQKVLNGGPVGSDRGFVLHANDYFNDDASVAVTDDLCMTATREILNVIAGTRAPEQVTMLLGYAGWGAGQIEKELGENAWLVADSADSIIFGDHHDEKWDRTLAQLGIDPAKLHLTGGQA